jgi:hypothetical protein
MVEEVTEQFDDTAVGTPTDEDQRQNQLPQPVRGDRQIKQDVDIFGWRVEGAAEGLLSKVNLLVDELATDVMLLGEFGDGPRAGESLDGEALPLSGVKRVGREAWRGRGVSGERRK